ncbi:MAG: extracellular solute-binding protein [Treponema sp.]|jgi:raffinose/stachyose/melibiose transport system substrate-binding protein|nr:extracellular solute-binding protein [Treponema sp.]
MIMVKRIALLLLILPALAACRKRDDSGSAVQATGTSGQAGGASITLEFMNAQSTEPGLSIFADAVNRFMADNPGVKVNQNVIANDSYKQKLAVAMASGILPDIYFSWSGGPMYEYVKSNNIIDLTPYMDAGNYKDKFLDAAIAQATYNGKIYGVPIQNVSVCSVFYNKDIFARYNLSIPTTLTELEAVCDTLLANRIKPFSLANKTQWTGSMYFMFLATRYGGTEPFIKAVDGSGTFEDPAFIYAGKKIQEWVGKGYFNEGFNGLDEDSGQGRMLLYNEDAAMHIMGSWFVSSAYSESPEFAQKLGIFKFPRIEEGAGNPDTVIGTVGDNFYHVSSTCKNPDAAFKMITYLTDDIAAQKRQEGGNIPPLKNVKLTDPILAELFAQVQAAPDMQLWYDQSMSPEVAEVHKTTSQQIFGGELTPEAAAKLLQEAQAAYLKN